MSPPGESCVVGANGTSPAACPCAEGISLEVGDVSAAVGDEHGFRPWSSLKSDKNEPCETCETHLAMLVMSVEERLVKLLKGVSAVGGVTLQGSLHHQAPLTIDGGGKLQTTKEHCRCENCRNSLATKRYLRSPRFYVLDFQGTAMLGR